MVKLVRNVLIIIILLTVVWAAFLLVSYVTAITVLYTLEFSGETLISIARVILGLLIFGAWIMGWYKLTKFWLYKILLPRKREA